MTRNRVGEQPDIVTETFRDDIEMATRFFGSAATVLLHPRHCRSQLAKFSRDRAEPAVDGLEAAIHRSFEMGNSHRRPVRAHHNIVALRR